MREFDPTVAPRIKVAVTIMGMDIATIMGMIMDMITDWAHTPIRTVDTTIVISRSGFFL